MFAIRELGPLVTQIVEHSCPLSNVYCLWRPWMELEGLHTIHIVKVDNREDRHIDLAE